MDYGGVGLLSVNIYERSIDEVYIGCSFRKLFSKPVTNFTHSVIEAVGSLVQAGSRVGFLLFITVTSH